MKSPHHTCCAFAKHPPTDEEGQLSQRWRWYCSLDRCQQTTVIRFASFPRLRNVSQFRIHVLTPREQYALGTVSKDSILLHLELCSRCEPATASPCRKSRPRQQPLRTSILKPPYTTKVTTTLGTASFWWVLAVLAYIHILTRQLSVSRSSDSSTCEPESCFLIVLTNAFV